MKLVIPPECDKWVKLQGGLEAQFNPEHYSLETARQQQSLQQLIKGRTIRRVLDLGCGLGRAAVALHDLLKDPTVVYFLADYTGYSGPLIYGWTENEIYNDLAATALFCTANGLTNYQLIDLDSNVAKNLVKRVDLVISWEAVGFHVPVESYIDWLTKVSVPGARWILQVNQIESLGNRDRYHNGDFGAQLIGDEYLVFDLLEGGNGGAA